MARESYTDQYAAAVKAVENIGLSNVPIEVQLAHLQAMTIDHRTFSTHVSQDRLCRQALSSVEQDVPRCGLVVGQLPPGHERDLRARAPRSSVYSCGLGTLGHARLATAQICTEQGGGQGRRGSDSCGGQGRAVLG